MKEALYALLTLAAVLIFSQMMTPQDPFYGTPLQSQQPRPEAPEPQPDAPAEAPPGDGVEARPVVQP